MIGDGTIRKLKCKYYSKKYNKTGVWFFRHFEKKHPDKQPGYKEIFINKQKEKQQWAGL